MLVRKLRGDRGCARDASRGIASRHALVGERTARAGNDGGGGGNSDPNKSPWMRGGKSNGDKGNGEGGKSQLKGNKVW